MMHGLTNLKNTFFVVTTIVDCTVLIIQYTCPNHLLPCIANKSMPCSWITLSYAPKCTTSVHRFLFLLGYHRHFLLVTAGKTFSTVKLCGVAITPMLNS